VQEGGYQSNPRRTIRLASRITRQASRRGLYVVIDWHILTQGDPNDNLDRATRFFNVMARRFGDQNNIIYEIANEPNGVPWKSVRGYAETLIPRIRAIDPEAPIVVGTPGWSSLGVADRTSPNRIVRRPVRAANILYAFHFYAASHRGGYLRALRRASRKLPIFTTEFGSQEFTGDGPNDFAMANRFIRLMNRRKISWIGWNYSDDFRSGAVFRPGTCASGSFAAESALKPAGTWIRRHLRR
ncbi:MAG: glycoside hydrolase family 5 protein, partial [Nocardioides sp.]